MFAALVSVGLCKWLTCCPELPGAGDEVPDVPIAPVDVAPVIPATPEAKLGFPKRSTPSLAAEMMAEPSIEASKRDGIDEVLPKPRPWDTDPVVVVAAGVWRAVSIGLLCWRLAA